MPLRTGTPVERCLLLFVSLDVELAGVDAGSCGQDALNDGGEERSGKLPGRW